MNRYSYVLNNPLGANDPSGLDNEAPPGSSGGVVLACAKAVGESGADPFADIGCGLSLFDLILSLFPPAPSLHGSLTPRPSVRADANTSDPWNESLGYPKGGPQLGGGWSVAGALGIPLDQGCEFGACGFQQGGGWEIDKRPLQGVPFAQGLGLFHYYFYNTSTHESVGLGPAKGSGMFCSVPGKFETNEKRGTLYLPIPSASQQKCVDEKLRHRGSPGNYTFYNSFGDRRGSMNCHGYVSSVVAACALQ